MRGAWPVHHSVSTHLPWKGLPRPSTLTAVRERRARPWAPRAPSGGRRRGLGHGFHSQGVLGAGLCCAPLRTRGLPGPPRAAEEPPAAWVRQQGVSVVWTPKQHCPGLHLKRSSMPPHCSQLRPGPPSRLTWPPGPRGRSQTRCQAECQAGRGGIGRRGVGALPWRGVLLGEAAFRWKKFARAASAFPKRGYTCNTPHTVPRYSLPSNHFGEGLPLAREERARQGWSVGPGIPAGAGAGPCWGAAGVPCWRALTFR